MDNKNYKALTLKWPGVVPTIITDIGVSLPVAGDLLELTDERIYHTKAIDYVDEWNKTQEKMFRNIGRNDKCPCGSGKKYKNCHKKSTN
jgi:uncharacterized protein YecA (UPF0149 family)